MPNFDIESLLDSDFDPPRYRCERCLALWKSINHDAPADNNMVHRCKTCGVEYREEYHDKIFKWGGEEAIDRMGMGLHDYLLEINNFIKIEDPLNHAKKLAHIARNFHRIGDASNDEGWSYPYLKALLQAFSLAQNFIHFVSFGGLSPFMSGVLKLTAQRVRVAGIISGGSGYYLSNLLKEIQYPFNREAYYLSLRVLANEGSGVDFPHQKLIVVDGLIAFKGSANFNEQAWRKAEDDKEEIQIVTDIDEVIALNNRFFSTAWIGSAKDDMQSIAPLEITIDPFPYHPLDVRYQYTDTELNDYH